MLPQGFLKDFTMRKRTIFLLWTEFTQHDVPVLIMYTSGPMDVSVKVEKEVFLETFARYKDPHAGGVRLDNFVNIMVYISNYVFHKSKGRRSLGTVLLYTQAKTSEKKIGLKPTKTPIIVKFTRKRGSAKGQSFGL
ncbi:hypothetical protein ElyMa_001783600 [Elysia marginata]|uniref:PiggyBac transposable element-derived protein domain-containing protein n=1 Tax=Elysia marginata TaxID=1093978 RepID=A0AAV4EEE3_9GAST|nr:hypothetical protein ElyMa_001783600 [Elysia marginata]